MLLPHDDSTQALDLDPNYLTHLNYAVTLANNDEPERAREHFNRFRKLAEVSASGQLVAAAATAAAADASTTIKSIKTGPVSC